MAIQTRKSQGSWSSVGNAPSYGAVVSQYASAIKQAQIAQENTELQGKVFDYQEGNLSYQDLTAYLNGKLSEATPDSKKALDLRMLLADAGKAEDNKQVRLKRAELEAKFAKGGISADEQLQIEREMLQYIKEGTPEYTEQLSSIATVQELARVEKNNMEVAKLQSELSKGGITTEESIRLFKKMRDYTEPGSQDRADIDVKLGTLEETRKEERLADARNQLLSDMYDKYTEGGISLEEELDMTRQMQSLTTPGTEEYIKLKQAEADVLGKIAEESQKKGSLTAATNEIKAFIAERETAISKLDTAFKSGVIPPEKYLEEKYALQAEIGEALSQNPELVAATTDLSTKMGSISAAIQDTENTFNMVQSGEILPIRDKTGKFEFIPNNKDALRANTAGMVGVSKLNTETGQYEPDRNEAGDILGDDIVTVVQNGKPVTMRLHEDGSLEPLNQTADGTFIETGMRYDPITKRETKATDVEGAGFKAGDNSMFGQKAGELARKAFGRVTGIGPERANKFFDGLKNLPENIANKKQDLESRVTMSPSKPSILADAKNAAKSLLSTNLKTASASNDKSKKTSTKVTLPSASASIDSLLKSIKSNTSSFKMPTLNLPQSTPGKINIGKINLPEYGVSEKISSTAKNLFSKAKSFVSGLFK